MSLLDAIKAMIPQEVIHGASVDEAAEAVSLDVAFSPVVRDPVREDWLGLRCPQVCEVEQRGDRYLLRLPGSDFEWVDPETLKRMRARYLLIRGWYHDQFKSLCHPLRQQVLGAFFPGGLWQPKGDG